MGILGTWSSPYLSQLEKDNRLNSEEKSWVGSLMNFGRIFGAIIGAVMVSYFGCKNSIIPSLVPLSLCWTLTMIADLTDKPLILCWARISGGLSLGMVYNCFPLYIGEFSLPEIRGAIVSFAFCGTRMGNVVVTLIGTYLSMTWSSVIFLASCLINMAIVMWLPDSPYYLAKVGKLEKAKKALDWYRYGQHVEEEFEAVKSYIAVSNVQSFRDKLSEFKYPHVRKALFISTVLFGFMQVCGFNTILLYMEEIIRDSQAQPIEAPLATTLILFSGVIMTIFTVNLMDICGRRMLLMVSGFGVFISMFGLGTHFLLVDEGFDPNSSYLSWLPETSLFVFVIFFGLGLMPVPSAVLGELFPSNIKCIASCMSTVTAAVLSFLSSKAFHPMTDLVGYSYVFYMHGMFGLLVLPFVILFVPETKGKTFSQIQDILVSKA